VLVRIRQRRKPRQQRLRPQPLRVGNLPLPYLRWNGRLARIFGQLCINIFNCCTLLTYRNKISICAYMLRFCAWIFWMFSLSPTPAAGLPQTLRDFVSRSVSNGSTEYCGCVLRGPESYYLFILSQPERIGVMFIREDVHRELSIVGADTSLTSIKLPVDRSSETAILSGAQALLGSCNLKLSVGATPFQTPTFSQIGLALDRVLLPITGFSFQTNATLDILRELQEANALSFEPRKAPAGSILICPTRFAPAGPVELGHAGILAHDRWVYAADAERHGAWRRSGTLDQWLEKFGSAGRVYAFLLRAPAPAQQRARVQSSQIR
jgi:hypothetical protein